MHNLIEPICILVSDIVKKTMESNEVISNDCFNLILKMNQHVAINSTPKQKDTYYAILYRAAKYFEPNNTFPNQSMHINYRKYVDLSINFLELGQANNFISNQYSESEESEEFITNNLNIR